MASLSTLRANTLIYLGTTAADKAYPTATLDLCINNAINTLLSDIDQANPGWLTDVITLTATSPTSHIYGLPSDFLRWLEVRLDDEDGAALTEVRMDELSSTGGYAFAITGPDFNAVLTTGEGISAGTPIYCLHSIWPADLTNPAGSPEKVPLKFHDLIALFAAEEAMGLGGEGALPITLVERKLDRHAQLMLHVARRGIGIMQTRE